MVTTLGAPGTPVGLMQVSESLILKSLLALPSGRKRGLGTDRLPFLTNATYCRFAWSLVTALHGPAQFRSRIFPCPGFTNFAPFGARVLIRPLHPAPVPGVQVSAACTVNEIRVVPAPYTPKLFRKAETPAHLHGC